MRLILVSMIVLLTYTVAGANGLSRAGTCGGCHVENFNVWQASPHARSISSAEFRGAFKAYLKRADTDDGGLCFRCHAPAILISGGVFEATKRVLRGRTPGEGVTCIACHSVESVKEGRAVRDPGESRNYHRVRDLRSIDRERFCTTCHSSYEEQSAGEVKKTGLRTSLVSSFNRVVGTETAPTVDHGFPGAIVLSKEGGSCPGMDVKGEGFED